MPRYTSNLRPLESIKIKHDVDMGFSMANSSNSPEDYRGGPSVAIPFNWESQPGTPKVKFRRENPLPPLTPPPSYFYTTPKKPTKSLMNHSYKYNLLNNILPKRATRKSTLQVSPASLSSSSSSQSSPPCSPSMAKTRGLLHCETSSTRESFDLRRVNEEAEGDQCKSPVSTLCSCMTGRGVNNKSQSLYASLIKVLLKS